MWLIENGGALLTDLYELTMAQVYFGKQMRAPACFEVTVRRLPDNWGFFVMAGLSELESYLAKFRFVEEDLQYLRSTQMFSDDFLEYLSTVRADVKVRCLPEGTVFFPHEPILEVTGPLICAQLLESYTLNMLGFSIVAATLAARVAIAAKGSSVIDFGLRRCQGPVASVRAARGAQIAGLKATSNVFAAKQLDFAPSGTMAHSYIQVHESEEDAFRDFAGTYGESSILLVDTYNSAAGIKTAARVAKRLLQEKGLKIRGIRIDSGDFVALSKFARDCFRRENVPFLKIFASGDLDEFKIQDLLKRGAEIDGFGVGTRFGVSRYAPAIEIVYKLVQYADKGLSKSSPDKQTRPGRKMIRRFKDKYYTHDIVSPLASGKSDLLQSFESAEPIQTIRQRLAGELSMLEDSIKTIRTPAEYPVEFA